MFNAIRTSPRYVPFWISPKSYGQSFGHSPSLSACFKATRFTFKTGTSCGGRSLDSSCNEIVSSSGVIVFLTNFCAPFFKEIPSFFCGVTPSKTLAAPRPLNIAFCLGNGGVLRSEEGGGIQERRGRWGGGKKRRKKGRAKSAQVWGHNEPKCSKLP